MNEEYQVGYKKPPKKNRYKKGQSGNPTGRPKGKAALLACLLAELEREIPYIEDGKKKKSSKMQLICARIANDAMQGKAINQKMILDYLDKIKETNFPPLPIINSKEKLTALEAQKRFNELLRRVKEGTYKKS